MSFFVTEELRLETEFTSAILLSTFAQCNVSSQNLHTRARCVPWKWDSLFASSLALRLFHHSHARVLF
jgi:hypothetical protein